MINFYNFKDILIITPQLTTLSCVIYLYLRLNFYNIRNFISKFDSQISTPYNLNLNHVILYTTIIWISLLHVSSLIDYSTGSLDLLAGLYLLIIGVSRIKNNHFLLNSLIVIIISCFLATTDNLLNFFFILELNTYLFLYLTVCQSHTNVSSNNKSIINSSLITFIMNFFSSILIFGAITYTYYYNGSVVFSNSTSLISSLFYLFILLKLFSGPWVYFGVEVYKGLRFITLAFYTLVFLIVVLPKMILFLNFFTFTFTKAHFFPIMAYIWVIFSSINSISSLKIFLAYSTSFILIYLIVFYSLVNVA